MMRRYQIKMNLRFTAEENVLLYRCLPVSNDVLQFVVSYVWVLYAYLSGASSISTM